MEIRVLSFVAKGKKEAQFDFDLQFKCGTQDITKKTIENEFYLFNLLLVCVQNWASFTIPPSVTMESGILRVVVQGITLPPGLFSMFPLFSYF
mmetsp:Transcript_30671/g.47318  ORF Transcript_30671/g.47318 Transcript_30671/m.47318 type:complete len:93 (+) Transcript_30671:284-562(+)